MLMLAAFATARAADCSQPPTERYEPRSFLGYACEDDCRRHKKGFAWAERHEVTDSTACARLQPAQAEGCLAFAEQSLSPGQAGYRWALENEVADPCLCEDAGERFRDGCRQALVVPAHVPATAAPRRGRGAPGRFAPRAPAGKLRR
jgi:hypothetical protein